MSDGFIKVAFFYTNCSKKLFKHFSLYFLTFLSWTFLENTDIAHFFSYKVSSNKYDKVDYGIE